MNPSEEQPADHGLLIDAETIVIELPSEQQQLPDETSSETAFLPEQQYQILIEAIPQLVWMTDADGNPQYFNRRWHDYTAFSVTEDLNANWAYLVHPEDQAAAAAAWMHAVKTGEPYEVEYRLRRHDGIYCWFLVRGVPLKDPNGQIVRWFGTCTDIDRQKTEAQERGRMELALRAAQVQLRLVTDAAPSLISYVDRDQYFRFNNQTYSVWFQRPLEEITGRHIREVLGPAAYKGVRAEVEKALNGERITFERAMPYQGTEHRYVQIAFVPDNAENGEVAGFVAVVTDLTERKRAEQALAASETRLRLLVEQSPLSIQILAPNGYTVQVNRAWEELWGVTLEDLHNYNMLEDQQLVEKGIMPYIRRAFAGEAVAIPPIVYDTEQTLPNRTRHADPRRWTQAFMYPVKDESGNIREVVLIHEDITERKQMEEAQAQHLTEIERLNERLRQSIQETHHRVKNNLQILAAMVDLQTMDGKAMLPASEFARLSQHIRALAAVHDVLTAHHAEPRSEVVSVQEILRKLLPILQSTLGERRLSYTLDDAWLPIRQVSSLALCTNELISNSMKHGRGEVRLLFQVQNGSAKLEVSEHGPGFPPGFDPDVAANTGLQLIRNLTSWDLRGKVEFASAEQGGARVTLTLPLAFHRTQRRGE